MLVTCQRFGDRFSTNQNQYDKDMLKSRKSTRKIPARKCQRIQRDKGRKKKPKPEPASKDRRAEEAKEEKKRQKFVLKEMRKEELEIEAKRAAKRQRMASEVEIGDFLWEQRNRALVEETENGPGQENVDERSEDSQIRNQSQDRKDLEYEYVTSHDDLAHKVNERKTTPRLVSYEIGAESEVKSE
jgi:hypothetical protein